MIWGETGTREGAKNRQLASVAWLFAKYGITSLHDGDCKGVDSQLYDLAVAFRTNVFMHPPTNPNNRAFRGMDNTNVTILPRRGYFVRDRDMVDASEVMVGVPKQNFEPEESWKRGNGGTWYTINYARNQEKPLAIVWPNGLITYERWESMVAL